MKARNPWEADGRAKKVAKLVPVIMRALPDGLTSKTVGMYVRTCIPAKSWAIIKEVSGVPKFSPETLCAVVLAIEADYEFAEELDTSTDLEIPSFADQTTPSGFTLNDIAPASGVVFH